MKDDNQFNQPTLPEDQVPTTSPEPVEQTAPTINSTNQPFLSNQPIMASSPELEVESEPATGPDQTVNDEILSQEAEVESSSESTYESPRTDPYAEASMPTPSAAAATAAPVVLSDGSSNLPSLSQKDKGKKKLIIGSIIAGTLLLLGGAGAAAYTMWYQNPDKVLSDAVVNMVHAETVTYTGSIDLINLAGEGNASMVSSVKSIKLAVNGKNDSAVGDSNATLTVDYEGKKYDVNGAVLVDKDTNLYVKIGGVKKMLTKLAADNGGKYEELPSYIRDVITKLDDKWVRIAADDLKELDDDYEKTKSCTDQVFKKLKDDKLMTDELADMYKKNAFVVVKETLPSKDGSLGYVIDADTKKAHAFAKAANNSKLVAELKKCDESFDLKDESIDESFENTKTENSTDTTRVEVWIDRWSHELTKVSLTTKSKELTANAVMEPVFNQKVNVSAPKEFIKVGELKKIYEDAMKQYEQEPLTGPETSTEVMSGSFSSEL